MKRRKREVYKEEREMERHKKRKKESKKVLPKSMYIARRYFIISFLKQTKLDR